MKTRITTQNSVRFVFLFLMSCVLFVSCSKDELQDDLSTIKVEDPKGKKIGDLIVNDSTLLLNESSLKSVKSTTDNLVIFASKPDQADEIKNGAILIGAIYDGYSVQNIMGRVENVEVKGSEWHVSTKPVKLEEFIYSGTITGRMYAYTLKNKDGSLRSSSEFPPVVVQNVEGFSIYSTAVENPQTRASVKFPRIEYSNEFKYTAPLPTGLNFDASFSLTAGFTPVLDYTIKFGLTGVTEFKIQMIAKDVLLDSHVKVKAGLKYEISGADLYSLPIAPIILGPTGLVISPTFSVGPYFEIEAGIEVDAKLFHVEGDISYMLSDPLKAPISTLKSDPYTLEDNLKWTAGIRGEGGLQFAAGVSLTFFTLNIASVGGMSKLGIGMSLNPIENNSKLSFDIYGRVDASARIVLGTPPLKFEKEIASVSWKPSIYHAEVSLKKAE